MLSVLLVDIYALNKYFLKDVLLEIDIFDIICFAFQAVQLNLEEVLVKQEDITEEFLLKDSISSLEEKEDVKTECCVKEEIEDETCD